MATKIASKAKVGSAVEFTFSDKNGTKLVCNTAELSKEMLLELALHGIAQKVGDSYASAESVQDALDNAKRVWDNLKAGNFNSRSSGVGSILVEAIARIKKIAADEAQKLLEAMDEEKLEVLRKKEAVKAMVTIIRGERAAAKLSGSSDDLEL